jgi:hypothetical protein
MIVLKKMNLIVLLFIIVLIVPSCKEENTTKKDIYVAAVPNEPAKSCELTKSEFKSWFVKDTIVANGVVSSANSLTDPFKNNCDFYKWSWRMFLWHFSPKDDSYVYDTAPFYDLEGENLVIDGKQTKVRGGKLEREGQAGLVSGVLMSQKAGLTPNGSIVYYAIHVNDVYGYMVSGQKEGKLDLTQFPTTKKELDMIIKYAKEVHNVDIKDGKSLTMELKSSWIKLPKKADKSKYITITADVPKFTKTNDKEWVWDGSTYENNVTLAMVGYHVVGSAAGHPEMIWATFEHNNNVPDVNYYYVDSNGEVKEKKTLNEDGTPIEKGWTFTNDTTKMNASNQMHMELENNTITAQTNQTISPSSTMRTHPWGNKPDAESAVNNTEIISINRNVSSMLIDGDVRKNYFLVGATWTSNGVPGVGNQLPVVDGSKVLANSTMETYFQYKNCFDCHKGGNLGGLSHIYDDINPLPQLKYSR